MVLPQFMKGLGHRMAMKDLRYLQTNMRIYIDLPIPCAFINVSLLVLLALFIWNSTCELPDSKTKSAKGQLTIDGGNRL
jgi:hypothetical protein